MLNGARVRKRGGWGGVLVWRGGQKVWADNLRNTTWGGGGELGGGGDVLSKESEGMAIAKSQGENLNPSGD